MRHLYTASFHFHISDTHEYEYLSNKTPVITLTISLTLNTRLIIFGYFRPLDLISPAPKVAMCEPRVTRFFANYPHQTMA